MKISGNANLDNVRIVPISTFSDRRGDFSQLFIPEDGNPIGQLVQSRSRKAVFRGLHWQDNMNKYIRVVRGAAKIINVHLGYLYGINSQLYLKSNIFTLSEEDTMWVYADYFVARGIYVLEDNTILEYVCSTSQDESKAHTLNLHTPELEFPELDDYHTGYIIRSEKDINAPHLLEVEKQFGFGS